MKSAEPSFPILQVDIIRGLAAVFVFLAHAVETSLSATVMPEPGKADGMARLLLASLGSGTFWVWGFFVISGLCIHRSIAKDIVRQRFSWLHYSAARLSRIYPVYLVGLVGALIVAVFIAWRKGREWELPVDLLVGNLFMTQAYTKPVPHFGPSWSLTCEIIYYAFWPVCLWLCDWRTWRSIAVASIGVIIGHIIFSMGGNQDSVTGSLCIYALLWIAGAGLAEIWPRWSSKITRPWWLLGWALLASSYLLAGWGNYHDWSPVGKTRVCISSLPGWLLVIGGARHFAIPTGSRRAAWAEWLGTLSYPCYILHRPLLALAASCLPTAIFMGSWVGAAVRLVGSVLPGFILIATAGLALERAVMSRRQRWLETLRPRA